MTRRVLCSACDAPVSVEQVTTLKSVLQAPVAGGMVPLPIKADADLCSGECLARYVLEKLLPDLGRSLVKSNAAIGRSSTRWRDESPAPTSPPLDPPLLAEGEDES